MLEPRDLVYVPPRETHVLENVSDTEPAEYVVARDSPHEDAVIVPWAEAPETSLPGWPPRARPLPALEHDEVPVLEHDRASVHEDLPGARRAAEECGL